jgi:hypothetical protein
MRHYQRNVSAAVSITRQQVEEWFDAYGLPWSRVPNTEGVYLLGIGGDYAGGKMPTVAIRMNTSIGSSGSTIGKGAKGSMSVLLVSTVTNRVLNRKLMALPGNPGKQRVFRRVENWRTNWAVPVREFMEEYASKAAFYDRIARETSAGESVAIVEQEDVPERAAERTAATQVMPPPPVQAPGSPALPAAAQSDDPRLVALRVGFLVATKDLGPIDPSRAKQTIEIFTAIANDFVKPDEPVPDSVAKRAREKILELGVPFIFPTDAEWKTHLRRSGSARNGRRSLRNSPRRRNDAPHGFPF